MAQIRDYEIKQLTLEWMNDPQPGHSFDEMMAYQALVLDRYEDTVVWIKGTDVTIDSRGTKFLKAYRMDSVERFKKYHAYQPENPIAFWVKANDGLITKYPDLLYFYKKLLTAHLNSDRPPICHYLAEVIPHQTSRTVYTPYSINYIGNWEVAESVTWNDFVLTQEEAPQP